jgi:hypothetical protein
MRIAIANEPSALGRLEDGGLEHPEVLLRTAKPEGWLHVDASAMVLHRQSQQVGMGDVPLRMIPYWQTRGSIPPRPFSLRHGHLQKDNYTKPPH